MQPTNQRVFIDNDGTFNFTDSGTDSYQWQMSTDGGTNFNDINDGTDYSGTQTNTLTVLSPDLDKNGFVFRVLLTSNTFICDQTISDRCTTSVPPQ